MISLFFSVAVVDPQPTRPCAGDPCGPYAICREVNNQRVCTCQPGFFGNPPVCRPECVVHTECPQLLACLHYHCVDPCKGTCGVQAECRVINHNPICSCLPGYTGDPFIRCTPAPVTPPTIPVPPYIPTTPSTTQRPTPLPPIAGTTVTEREPPIQPEPGTTTTTPKPVVVIAKPPAPPPDPCVPDPCGANTICRSSVDRYICECLPGYFGSPNIGCRPECILNTDCEIGYSCVRQKCVNPCPGPCPGTARCSVINHKAICSCPPGYQGDPYIQCAVRPVAVTTPGRFHCRAKNVI